MNQRVLHLQQICQRFGVAILYVFGSRSRAVQTWLARGQGCLEVSLSDVDIGVKALPGVVWDVWAKVELAQALETWLQVPRVDLIILEEAEPFLAANIIRGERLFCADEYLADEYDLYVLRRAGDLIPLERERQQLILERGR